MVPDTRGPLFRLSGTEEMARGAAVSVYTLAREVGRLRYSSKLGVFGLEICVPGMKKVYRAAYVQ